MPLSEAHPDCTAVLTRGVFNDESLACFPTLDEALRVRLCAVPVRTHHQARWAGLGVGARVYYALRDRLRSRFCDQIRIFPASTTW